MRKKCLIAACVLYPLAAASVGHAQDTTAMTGGTVTSRPDAVYLAQGWTHDEAERWYHISQGTVFMPAEWFVSLEQASGTALFAASDHLARLGFLPDPPSDANPFGLPVGFSVVQLDFPDNDGVQHYQNWRGRWVGLSCAACHTGQLNYHGQKIRIDGGPAHLDLEGFGDELGAALGATAASAPQFQRFAGRVLALGVRMTPDQLQQSFTLYLHDLAARRSLFVAGRAAATEEPTPPGFGRLDAVELDANILLAAGLGEVKNYVPPTAPVRYPMLWDTPYFDWVLYNATIQQPLARNVIEDLGVGAPVQAATILTGHIQHGVAMDNLVQIHRQLATLQSPVWPEDIFGKIDQSLAARGRVIFAQRCSGCHAVIDRATHRPDTVAADAPSPTITVGLVPLEKIGTDPRQAQNFASRTIDLEKIGGPPQLAYMTVVQTVGWQIVEQWAAQSPENAALKREIDAGRTSDLRSPLAYRARPLNGLWAAPPYLHNGSVPSLYELLLPPERRTRIFYVGSWEFDPVTVGLVVGSPFAGAFVFDTRLPGNSNMGHVYGTDLSNAERTAVIEYLKTL